MLSMRKLSPLSNQLQPCCIWKFFALDSTAWVSGKQLVSRIKPRDKRSAFLPNPVFYGPRAPANSYSSLFYIVLPTETFSGTANSAGTELPNPQNRTFLFSVGNIQTHLLPCKADLSFIAVCIKTCAWSFHLHCISITYIADSLLLKLFFKIISL